MFSNSSTHVLPLISWMMLGSMWQTLPLADGYGAIGNLSEIKLCTSARTQAHMAGARHYGE